MKLVATTLDNIDVAQLKEELAKVLNAGIDIIHFDISTGKKLPPGPFGEWMIANIAGCTNLCINVHLLDYAGPKIIKNSIACGADMITIPQNLVSKDNMRLVRDLGAILSVGVDIGETEMSPMQLPPSAQMVYLYSFKKSILSGSVAHKWEQRYLNTILSIRAQLPHIIIAAKLASPLAFSPIISELLKNVDFVTLDFFGMKDQLTTVEKVRAFLSPTVNPLLELAVSHDLHIKRDEQRLISIFESIDAKLPPKRNEGT